MHRSQPSLPLCKPPTGTLATGAQRSLYGALDPDVPVVVELDPPVSRAVAVLERRLGSGGLGVARVRPGEGVALRRALRGSHLRLRAVFLPRPTALDPERLIALDRLILSLAIAREGVVGRLGRGVLRSVPCAAAANLLPVVVVLASPEVTYGAWLRQVLPAGDPRRIVLTRGRGDGAVARVWGSRGRVPVGWVKRGDVGAEGRALRQLAASARTSEVQVPEVLGETANVLATTEVPGSPAAVVLGGQPARLPAIVSRLTAWLVEWHRHASRPRELGAADVERWILGPARELAGSLGQDYLDWLEARCAALLGAIVPFAPAHQDLTMVNVLADGTRLAVVDWETAAADAPPFADLPYAIADAAAASRWYEDRVRAFDECFGSGDGHLAQLGRAALGRAAHGSGASAAVLSFAFHACWLGHAVNDLRRAGHAGEFVRIAQRIAAHPRHCDPFLT